MLLASLATSELTGSDDAESALTPTALARTTAPKESPSLSCGHLGGSVGQVPSMATGPIRSTYTIMQPSLKAPAFSDWRSLEPERSLRCPFWRSKKGKGSRWAAPGSAPRALVGAYSLQQ